MKKTALVTGASRGIGAAIAAQLAADGYRVAINFFSNEDAAKELADKIGGLALGADVSVASQAQKLIERTIAELGKIDLLVNNAGISKIGLFHEISEEDADRLFAVNVKGPMNCSKFILPYMIRRKSGQIINIASMWGETGASCEVHYSASKAAVIGFTKALAKEVGPSGIRVNAVSPGVIMTDMNSHLSEDDMKTLSDETPLERIGDVQDIANAVSFLASPKANFITGQILSVNGGIII